MTLQRRLALRYGAVVSVCLLLLAGLTYHEFVQEPDMFRKYGIKEPEGGALAEYAEVFLYGAVPLIFALGWWFVRRSLTPINELAQGVERFHVETLRVRLPRSHNGDEVDRLAASFNNMAERLENSFQQIREFTLHASHELKTPLTVMRAQLDTALREAESLPPAQREWMHSQFDEVRRLARIVDTLTLLTKADAGLVMLERKPVHLDQLVRECFEDAVILAEDRYVQATLAVCEEVTVLGDRDRLRQLLLNLTDNAVKYNRPGGTVAICLRKTGDRAEVGISNTGEGLPAELQARVFDRFVRGDGARKKSADGCGLGLTICQWIVHGHDGTIEISSAPDQTTFKVQLPLEPPSTSTSI